MLRTILIDSNLLLVLMVASVDRDQVARFKRTRRYTAEDADLLLKYVAQFDQVLVTPHVLTETSNMTGQMTGRLLDDVRILTAALVPTWVEQREASVDVVGDPMFRRFGLTDAAIRRAATRETTVLTDDLELFAYLTNVGVSAVNFNHIRPLGWTR